MIVFDPSHPDQLITCQLQHSKTMLTAFFEANRKYPHARNYLYQDFPTYFTYIKSKKEWKEKERGNTIGRIYFASPNSGERFYLQTLLTITPGPASFPYLRTVNGILY